MSEQRRALLLPQEVKELKAHEAIIFYEGLRPIRCRKIRYFTDRWFIKRLAPPPKRASPMSPEEPPPAVQSPDAAGPSQEGAAGGAGVRDQFRPPASTLPDPGPQRKQTVK